MKVSLNTIKQFTDIDLSVDELVAKINSQLGSVDEVTDLKDVYKDAVIVKVVTCEKHPAADRLNVTKIDDGGTVQDVERDENGFVQVVCGAPNVTVDMFAVWLPPRSTVPGTYHDDEPFILGARELRGVMSQGMLAASDELGIGTDHDGILAINPDEWKPNDIEIKPGANFAKCFSLDDTIIDIENKMFTHRPDLFGQLGVAREIAGIQGKKFQSPAWYTDVTTFSEANELPLETFNDAPEKVPRMMFVAMSGIEIKPSPLWLQCALVAMGSKPINNIVDVTNYVMLLTAQPTHAYDYDKLRGAKIGARMAYEDETITLLNGKHYTLTPDDIVIADGDGAIGLGGIMGGGDSEVTVDTKNIVLEVGTFDMYTLRRSSMRHGVFTDALTRFNKGQSPLQNYHIMSLLIMSIGDVSEAKQTSDIFDMRSKFVENVPTQSLYGPIMISSSFINQRLGLKLSDENIMQLLENVEIRNHIAADKLCIDAPFWRTDLELPEDIVEEVGRLYGFDKLTNELPRRPIAPAKTNALLQLKSDVRSALSRLGMNEVLTYSFVHEKLLKNAGQNPEHAYRISNALSPDLQYYRLSLMPSMLDKVHMNIKNRYESFGLYEINKVHFKDEMEDDEPSVPNEDHHVGAVFAASDKAKLAGSAFYLAKRYLDELVDMEIATIVSLNEFDLSQDVWGQQLTAPYAPNRSALVVKDGQVYGVIGEFSESVRRSFKLPEYSAGFEVHLEAVSSQKQAYEQLPRFPAVTQDVSIEIDQSVPVADIEDIARNVLDELDDSWHTQWSIISQYAAEGSMTKSVTLRLVIANHERSLTDQEVTAILDTIKTAATTRLPLSS